MFDLKNEVDKIKVSIKVDMLCFVTNIRFKFIFSTKKSMRPSKTKMVIKTCLNKLQANALSSCPANIFRLKYHINQKYFFVT